MRKQMTTRPIVIKDMVHANGVKPQAIKRISEEGLFNLFTADIMKMKIKFTR